GGARADPAGVPQALEGRGRHLLRRRRCDLQPGGAGPDRAAAPGLPAHPARPGGLMPGARLDPPPQPPARSARAEQIVRAAARLLEEEGPQALTMRRLADELGIQAPSIYKHFASKAAVELALVSDALWEIGRISHAAGPALATEYRRFATASPNRYRLAT